MNLEGLFQDGMKYPTHCLFFSFFPYQNVSTRLRKDNTSLDKPVHELSSILSVVLKEFYITKFHISGKEIQKV